MSTEAQRVVVIQDSSRDVCPSAIKWIIEGFSLKPGDVLTLVGILHQVNSPSTLSHIAGQNLHKKLLSLFSFMFVLGYKVKVDASSMFGVNPKFISEEIAKKRKEYSNNAEITSISKLCESKQIEFHIKVHAGASAKGVALKAIKNLKATWVILDRQMKKDKKYFMEKLSCGISRMKRDSTIEQLRGPEEIDNRSSSTEGSTSMEGNSGSRLRRKVRYDEMIPGSMDGIFPHKPITPSSSGNEKQLERGKEITRYSNAKSNDQTVMTAASTSGPQEDGSTTHTITETQEAQTHISPTGFEQKGQKETSPGEQQKLPLNNDDCRGESPNDDEVFQQSICSVCKNRRPRIGWKRDFSYAELHAATGGFSGKNFLSEGGFGSVFKGELNGMKIAVKQHKNASFQGEKEFKSEVNVLSGARHENLVMLLGSCSEGSRRLLVYEFVCNGSLDQHISQHSRRPLSWEKRMKIAMGIAKGLKYLHENNIIHRDMRPNNILTTHDHHVLLGDFGLARTNADHTMETTVVGTLGYLAPEYAECGKVSTKSDVYAFGVVLLQLITGFKTTDKALEGKSLVGWARPLLKERNYPGLIDPRILDSHDVHQLFWMVRVAEKCLSKDPHKRLTMDKVVYALDYLIENNKSQSISELSPVQSDSFSSTRESCESIEDDTSYTEENVSSNSMDVKNVRLPPSPPMPTISSRRSSATYERSSSSRGTNSETEGRKETSYSRRSLLYSEMII
ncbi:hypothetical protein K2173_018949 [Erythroxylum novogranatense]|uniref:Protein kinase domain-containing protein n=1 Tax=Erythroxylum novogranatense TaxID=1862640 RepID=A0AAV8SS81_9ROSI|nr:hypothetical protein K2173_018949 [Erythroxylum novogranatense]